MPAKSLESFEVPLSSREMNISFLTSSQIEAIVSMSSEQKSNKKVHTNVKEIESDKYTSSGMAKGSNMGTYMAWNQLVITTSNIEWKYVSLVLRVPVLAGEVTVEISESHIFSMETVEREI